MDLKPLFTELANIFTGPQSIEKHAQDALLSAEYEVGLPNQYAPLAQPLIYELMQEDALPICSLIAEAPFNWEPPRTINDPLYVEHSVSKAHIELLGPEGLVKSDTIRLGLYGMKPNSEYGNRTHPAEEIYIMLAGQSFWKCDNVSYLPHLPGERSYHPSMMPHASMTKQRAFMSVYAWSGDISTQGYIYQGK
ncbi:MAG: dimethylsulfonioproprionate lyase family protein [Pseudomonadota bacterium]